MTLSRRSFLTLASVLALPRAALATGAPVPFSRADVIAMARARASRPFSPRPSVPRDWLDLSYEDYQTRWFRTADALWSGTARPYEVDFFLPGLYFPRAVAINTVESGRARRVPFDLSLFDKTDKAPDLSEEGALGYSGFRLRAELNHPGIKNEFCVFQGASYFRAIGAGEVYGLSARGLALGTAEPSGEEFPDFVEFWLETPEPGQRNIVAHALLDSPSVTGAWRFDIIPGETCEMEVSATLFARTELTHLGLGPLTSMFLYDATDRTRFDDFRPAVHDSNGLMIENGAGEVIWRPLANPRTLQVSSFVDRNPRGFGLMQRARALSDFDDLEARYDKRPGLWVEPRGEWGEGSVTLVEIPSDKEIFDNIVAYWRPARPVARGARTDLGYRLTWGESPNSTPMPRVTRTAMGARTFGSGRLAVIEYEPSPLHDDEGALQVIVQSPHAEVSAGVLQRNPETGGMRLAFSFEPGARTLVELRAQLRRAGAMASEVWLYRWTA